jgi:hypothetical protein
MQEEKKPWESYGSQNQSQETSPWDDYAPVKKKDSTGSFSQLLEKSTTSATVKTTTQKPSVSSGGKPEGLYTSPDNQIAVFKKSEDGWYVDNNRSGNFIKLQKGDVEQRVQALEKDAKTLYDADYEKGLTWKPEAKPQVQAQRKTQTNDQKQQQELFKETFKALKEDDPIVVEKENISKLSKEVAGYVDKSEEKTVEDLTAKFKNTKYDIFDFEETGMGDMLKVTNTKTGQNIVIDLDGSETEKNMLEAFVEGNLEFREYNDLVQRREQLLLDRQSGVERAPYQVDKELEQINEKIKEQEFYRKGYALSKGKYASAALFGDKTVKDIDKDFKDKTSRLIGNSVILKEESRKVKEYEDNLKKDYSDGLITKEQYEEALNSEQHTFIKNDVAQKYNEMSDELKSINDDRDLMEKTVVEANLAKEERGDFGSNMLANFAYGFISPVRMFAEISEYNRPVYDSQGNRVFSTETLRKDELQDILPGVITDEYITSKDRPYLERVLSGIAESLGSSVAVPVGGASLAKAVGEGAVKIAGKAIGKELVKKTGVEILKSIAKKALLSPQQIGLFASSYMNFKDQINSDPNTEGIDEADKVLMSGAYAYVSSKLESLGMSKWFSKTPAGYNITSYLLGKAFKDLPKNATQEMIDNRINSSVKGLIAKGAISLTAKGNVEGTTEALQELADIGIKSAYNEIKGEEVFKNPSYAEIIDRISESYKLGMIGGTVMSSVSQTLSTAREVRTANQVNNLERLIQDPNLKQLFEDDIKTKVLSGQITKEQATAEVQELNESIGLLREIPDNVTDKTESFRLLSERKKLEQEIAGKDENLVAAQKARIADINNQLKTISENAVQKQAAGEVPVQPEAAVSGEMAQGKPQAEPQVVTEEGQAVGQEEVVEPTEEEIDLESKLAEDLGMIKSETKPRLRVEGIDIPAEEDIDVETIEKNLDKLPAYEVNFVTPTLSQDIQVNPIEESNSQVKEGAAETRTIESFEGVPMVVGMSDTLAAGKVVDSVGNTMDVEGGLLYNVLGKNKNAAWAGVTKEGAQIQYNEALELYNNNKNLFDQLWAEGKLPNGHVPMAIMRMADTAVNSNEAVFRYLTPLVKSQPEQNQRAALEALKGDINVKKKVKQKATVTSANKLDNFISSNNIDSLGQLFDMIVIDANNRAKGDTKNTLSLSERSLLFDLMISQQGIKTASKNTVNALFGAKNDPKSKAFLADTIYNDISEPSMMKTPKGNVVSVVGIDVLNGGVIPVEHGNYGFGPKGQMIALISNPKHGLDVFPEWKAKATRVFKENKKGEIPSEQKIGDEVGGAFFIDKAFRGAKVSMETSDVELLSAKLRFAFPDVAVSNSKEEFDRVLQEEGVRTKESEGKVILGMTKDGKIYLNPESDSLATPIHEFGHIWIDFLRSKASGKKGDALLSKGLSLVEGTKALQQAIDKYGDNALAREEALVELMATKGETIINESQKKQFKNWLNALFKYVKNFFVTSEEIFKDKKFNEYLDKMSLDDFINTGLADLFKGEAVSPKFKAKEAGKGAAELRFRVGDNVQNFINKARDNGYSDSAIKNVLIRNGVTKEDVDTALGKYKKELNDVVAKAKEKYDLSIERGNSEQKAQQSAMADLKKNDWYANANDKQREEAVRALTKELGGKIKKAPSVKKILGTPTPQTVTNNVATLRNEFIKARATAAREAQQDLKRRQRELVVAVNNMKRSGTVTAAQAAALAKKIPYLNVYNPVMVDRFLQYAERLFKNAEYQNILSEASKVRKSIKNFMKNNQANVTAMAKDFGKVNPAMVEDIEQYLENAKAVLNAVKRSKQDTDFPIKNAADIDVITKYTEDMLEKQEEQLKNEKLKEYQDLVDQGILSGDMTLKDINEIIKAIEEEGPKNRAKQETELRRFLNTRFEMYSTIVKNMLKTNVDPFTGDTVEVSDKDKEVLKRLLKVNLDDMSIKNAYTIVESMDNFIVNGITDGLDGAISAYEGDIEAKNLLKEGVKADKIKGLLFGLSPVTGRAIYENFATLPVLFDSLFKGVKSGMKVMDSMGFNLLSRGFAKATKIYDNTINEYGEKFSKTKPNDQEFNTSFNTYERGMFAYLKRTVAGNETAQKAEFKRRAGIIKGAIKSLREYGNEDQQKMANIYEEVYNKLGLNNADITIDQVQANVDPKNVEAVNWWIDQWSKHYSDLYDVSLDVYNTRLGKDINYTTDRISRINGKRELIDEATNKIGAFALDLDLTSYKDKSGVLMESNKNFTADNLNTGNKASTRFVNLDFDVSNASALRSALIDVNTASAVRRVDAFLNSRSYDKLFAEEKDADILKRRVQNYILRYKNKVAFSDPTIAEVDKYMDMVASIGATRALGGPSQAVLQTVPVFLSTLSNAGVKNMDFKGLVSDTDFHTWLNNSGYAIANRGMQTSTAIESANKYLDKVAETKGEKLFKGVMKLNEFWLKTFLSMPDVWIARNSWKTYYTQSLREQGIYNGDIDWKTHEINEQAADYAQHMVDRQQNVSDAAMMGDFMNSQQPVKKIVRKVVLPFANFIMNQKTRLYSDVRTLSSSTSTKEDKIKSAKSLAGLAVEMSAYNAIGYALKLYVYDTIAAALTGGEEDEEEKEKNKLNRKKFVAQNLIKDVFSPLPVLDGITIQGLNFIADKIQDKTMSQDEINKAVEERNIYLESRGEEPMTDREKEKFVKEFVDSQKMVFEEYETKKWIDLGTATIAIEKARELYKMIDMSVTGKFKKEFKGNEVDKVILPDNMGDMKTATTLSALYNLGLLPREFNSVATSMKKYIEKNAISEEQLEDYKVIKKEFGDVDGYKKGLLKSKMKIDNVINEIRWVEENGGLTKEQSAEYNKLREVQGNVYIDDLKKLQKGIKAEKIYKRGN